jgi:hypothetical protein
MQDATGAVRYKTPRALLLKKRHRRLTANRQQRNLYPTIKLLARCTVIASNRLSLSKTNGL